MSTTMKSSTSSKRGRKIHRKIGNRDKTQRMLAHTETQLRHASESRDQSTTDEVRGNCIYLVDIYTADVDNLRTELDKMEEKTVKQRQAKAHLAAWRNMGRAMPSKTLCESEMFEKFRDAIAGTAEGMSKAYAQAFLAGVGTGLNDLSKTKSVRKKKKTSSTEPGQTEVRRTSPRLNEEEQSVQGREDSDAEDSDGVDTSP